MLGKQGFRLISKSNSLVSRLFKAKYFPKESFLSAKMGANPSFVWRSLVAAQQMLRSGIARKVGDGTTVQIQNEPWLPSTEDPYVLTESEAISRQTVSTLMVTNERRWDEDLIRDVFVERDANLILAIPLSDNNGDGWYWRKEKYGHYSVKTAYNMIQEGKTLNTRGIDKKFWKNLWVLAIPPKVKMLLWRIISGCLPTKDKLRSKHVNINVECSLCNNGVESSEHLFLDCSFAKSCWSMVDISWNSSVQISFRDWAMKEFNEWCSDNRQLGAMICWTIWKCRNDMVWNQKCMEVSQAVISGRVALSQWKVAQDKIIDRSWSFINQDDGDEHWSPPSENKTKLNTDAAVYSASQRYSYAFVARNHRGELIEARSSCKEGIIAPECAEAMGIREALSWIKGSQQHDVVVETDCLVVVQAIRSNAEMLSYFGSVVQECRSLLKEMEDKGVILRFIKRSANNLTHTFASYSYSLADRIWRTSDIPPAITHVLEKDLV